MPKTMTTEEKNQEAIAERIAFIKQIDGFWYMIRDKSEYPGTEEIKDMLDLCTCVRANRFRFINGPRESDNGLGNVLFSRLKHHGAIKGKTVGIVKKSWNVDPETYRKLDTFAMLMSVCQGNINKEWALLLGMYATR